MFVQNSTGTTDIMVVDLKSGSVQGPFVTGYTYGVHHANAYEASSSQIIVDMSPTAFENLRDYFHLENMLNPPESGNDGISTMGVREFTRYQINLVTHKVSSELFPNTINSKFINNFDFPMINENYRGKKYCVVYGVSAYAYSRTALVKKNLCNPNKDKVTRISAS